jgi:hypothetical protein
MSAATWIGLGILPALAAVALLLWLLYSAATWAWSKLHTALIYEVKLKRDPFEFRLRGEPQPPAKASDYEESIEKIMNSLRESPHLRTFAGLGWLFIVVRDHKATERERDQERTAKR